MYEYRFINIRFNLDNEEEKAIYEYFNPNNRGGSIKNLLKQYLIYNKKNADDIFILNNTEEEEEIEEEIIFSGNGILIKVNGKETVV